MVSAPSQPARSGESDALLGSIIGGRFRVDARLAAGGMGVVYRAEQIPLGRPVALKVLKQPQSPDLDENFSKRFLLEAAAVANLSHPHTIVVHDYGRDGELLYFAMEYLEGRTLTEQVNANGPMHPAEAIHVALQVASSLQDAHAQGLVHRDLKPSNVMLVPRGGDPLFVKVLDFGLVKLVTKETKTKLTQSGIMLGSPRYMAPEQVRGSADVDHRADIYAFGAMLCFMLTGKPPFPEGSHFEAMRAHVYQPAPRLRELFPDCLASERLESIVLRCLEKSPDARYPWMGQIVEALKHAELAPVDTDAALDDKPTLFRDPSLVAPVLPASFAEPSSASRSIPATVAPFAETPAAGVDPGAPPSLQPSALQGSPGPVFQPPSGSSALVSEPPAAPPGASAVTWALRVGLVGLFVIGAVAAAL
ncbi:MAG: serine/threonine protein kinase, partial [Myxococcales bacterium]|nr:serine/threonine protein kinase [Myxococcales bacterium]